MKTVAEILRSPEFLALDERLRDPKWHPTPEEVAEALVALALPRKQKNPQQSLALTQRTTDNHPG